MATLLAPFVPFFLAFNGRPGSWGWQSPICSSFTTSREISRSTAYSVGGEGPSSPMPRNCSAPIPKGACERYRLVTIPVVDLDRVSFQAGDVARASLWFSMLYEAIAIVLSFFRELEQEIWSAGD